MALNIDSINAEYVTTLPAVGHPNRFYLTDTGFFKADRFGKVSPTRSIRTFLKVSDFMDVTDASTELYPNLAKHPLPPINMTGTYKFVYYATTTGELYRVDKTGYYKKIAGKFMVALKIVRSALKNTAAAEEPDNERPEEP
jgi:hypothetical protein